MLRPRYRSLVLGGVLGSLRNVVLYPLLCIFSTDRPLKGDKFQGKMYKNEAMIQTRHLSHLVLDFKRKHLTPTSMPPFS